MDICLLLIFLLDALKQGWSLNNTTTTPLPITTANNATGTDTTAIVTTLSNPTLSGTTTPLPITTLNNATDTTAIVTTLSNPTLSGTTTPLPITTVNHPTVTDTTAIVTTLSNPTLSGTTTPLPITTVNPPTVTDTTVIVTTLNNPTINGSTNPCKNGERIHGFCFCFEEWSGPTCDISTFCRENKKDSFTFPKTVLGQFASSIQQCAFNTPNAGIPLASALCNISTQTFESPQTVKCDLSLDTISKQISEAALKDKMTLSSSTQILTSKPESLTTENITNAVKIANILLSSDEFSPDIIVSTVAVVSQLLNIKHTTMSTINHDDISKLTKTLQKISLNEDLNSFLVQPNLAVMPFKGPSAIRQVQLTLFEATSETFLPDRIKINSSKSLPQDNATSVPDNMLIAKDKAQLQMNITFSKEFDKSVGLVLYDSDQFFQSQNFKSNLNTKRKVVSAILSEKQDMELRFSVTPSNHSKVVFQNFACVLWSYSKKKWSTEGCKKTGRSSGHVECMCKSSQESNSFTFSVLMSFGTNYQYSKDLNLISIIGCSISILGLAVTVVHQIVTRKSRGCKPTLLTVNMCMSMMIFYLLFLFCIKNPIQHGKEGHFFPENKVPESDHHQFLDEGLCTVFTALIHYFLLATFTWNFVYGFHVFLLFKATITGTPPWFLNASVAFGWGFPAIIVGISLGSTYTKEDPLGYRQEEFCWLASTDSDQQFDMRKPMFWAFLLPLVIMLISNTAILLHFSQNTCKTNPNLNRSRQAPLKKKILRSFSLAVMLGLSWIIGYVLLFTHDKTLYIILSVVFCVCNTTQGIQIFLFFTLRSILNSNPATLNAVNAPDFGLHRRKFFLWKVNLPASREIYTPTNPDPVSPPCVIEES